MKVAGWVLIAVGAAVVAAGILLGTGTLHRAGTVCGSAFGGVNPHAEVTDFEHALAGQSTDVQGECASAVSDRRTVAWVVLAPGAVLVVAGLGFMVAAWNRTPTRSFG